MAGTAMAVMGAAGAMTTGVAAATDIAAETDIAVATDIAVDMAAEANMAVDTAAPMGATHSAADIEAELLLAHSAVAAMDIPADA